MRLNTDIYDELLIYGGTVWNGIEFLKKDILIKSGIIAKIEDSIEEKANFMFDANNMIISSGLIDFHTHIKSISPDSIGIEPQKISYPLGVTSLVDALARKCDTDVFSENDCDISVLAEAKIINNKADFSLTEKSISAYKDKAIGLKVIFDKSSANVWSADPLKEICDFAQKNNLFVMVHTTDSPVSMLEIVNTLNKGDVISHAYHGGDNNSAIDCFLSLKEAEKKGIYIDAALSAHYHIDYSVFQKSVLQNICPDIISSDITKALEFVSGESYGLPICMSILNELGLDMSDVFKAVTVKPAEILKTKANKGFLRVGDVADIAVFKNNDCNITLTDRFDNKVVLKKCLKCVLTLFNDKIVHIDD